MTVSSADTDKVQYTGNGSTTAFAFNYGFYATADLKVYKTNTTTNVDTLQVLGTHYTLSAAPYTSGVTVTFGTAPSASERVSLLRILDVAQEADYVEADNFPASTHETALDKIVKQQKTLNRRLETALKAKDTAATSGLNYTLPTPVNGKALLFSGTTGDIVASTTTFENVITAAAASATASATSATASATSATASAASATASAASATTSSTQATNSAGSATLAQEWATKAEDSAITGYPGNYSSLHWARKAEDEKDAIVGTLSGDVFQPQQFTASFSATLGKFHVVDTSSGAVTATLASSPAATQMPYWFIPNSSWTTNAFTINPNGAKIEGVTGNRAFRGRRSFALVYLNSTVGYKVLFNANEVNQGNVYVLASSSPAPFVTVIKDLPASERSLSSYTSSGSFSLAAGVYDFDNFTVGAGHTMTLAAGTTLLRVRGTLTVTGNIASTTGATGTTVGDSYTRPTSAANGTNGVAGASVSMGAGNNATNGTNAAGAGGYGGRSASGSGGGTNSGGDSGAGVVSSGGHGAGGGGGESPNNSGLIGNANGTGGNGGAGDGTYAGGGGGSKGADGASAQHSQCTLILVYGTLTGAGNINLNGAAGGNGSVGSNGGSPSSGSGIVAPGGGGGGGGGFGGDGGSGGVFAAFGKNPAGYTGTVSTSGGVGGNGAVGGNGGNGGGGAGITHGGGGGAPGSGGRGGIGGNRGLCFFEYETGPLACTLQSNAGSAGTSAAGGTPGNGGTGSSQSGSAGGTSSTPGTSGAGLGHTYLTSPETTQREVFSV